MKKITATFLTMAMLLPFCAIQAATYDGFGLKHY